MASELIDRARTLSSSILDYELPSIEIVGGSIEDAVDIFSRINSKGAKISPDWMVSALTYNQEHNFRLGTEIDRLIFRLKEYNFEKIKRELVLQCIQSAFGKYYFDEKVAGLVKKSNFIPVAIRTLNSIVRAVAFLFEELLVIDSKLLPYNSQLIFLTYFFNEVPQPTHFQLEKLKYWFWVTTYSGYFTIYSLSKQRLAFNQFKEFITDPDVDMIFNDKPGTPFIVSEFPKTIYFGSVRAKALVLFLLNKGNDFTPINTANVDELKIYYLLENHQIPEGVVPMISYTPDQSDAEVVQTKHRDLSYMFDSPNFPEYAERFLLSDQMRNQYQFGDLQGILLSRKDLMLYHESQFVQSLGLVY
ncbi:hypothetical protein [Mucilaginibacter sp. OK268]|uniref:hypothetical protein n=1 Tax=Mucilaginibacter sp. OK268 TaxID=1881048 RepID=UPI000B841BA3|nr:hypothetical protein [Mucilaginibacter sp. OK268]